jgi:hypothetical protein
MTERLAADVEGTAAGWHRLVASRNNPGSRTVRLFDSAGHAPGTTP